MTKLAVEFLLSVAEQFTLDEQKRLATLIEKEQPKSLKEVEQLVGNLKLSLHLGR